MKRDEIRDHRYPHSFQRIVADGAHIFDHFDCAINGVVPRCNQCGNLVLRPRLVEAGRIFCSERCALESGVASRRAS
jgi:NAD-dependent SIR2 family protein deacetylase